jgi:hypothetical protein
VQAADDVGRLPKAVAAFLIGALVVCAAASTEAWPFSGWELFSRIRQADQRGWLATMTVEGAERPIVFKDLPRGFRGALHVMQGFPSLSLSERDAVCASWDDALDGRPTQINVYRTATHVSLDDRPPDVTRTLFHACP